ncbi:MAG: type II toxin-antitoxin system HicB family antitoxin [Erysipelotrichaceae bacterium]|nr:type II toxin-antitoxin system HicB family antitoxin [Erysipelotrichaceae bacterium]
MKKSRNHFGTKQYKGNLTLRIPSNLHRNLAVRAA